MKKSGFVMLFSILLFTMNTEAQSMGSDNRKFLMPDKIWLQNKNKETIGFSSDSLPKTFFESGVVVGCSRKLEASEQIYLVFQHEKGDAHAFLLNGPQFSPEVLAFIKKCDSESTLTVVVKHKDTEHLPAYQELPALHFVLK